MNTVPPFDARAESQREALDSFAVNDTETTRPANRAGFLRRFGFRLLAVYVVLYSLTWFEELIAGSETPNGPLAKFWETVVPWVGRRILGVDQPISFAATGSGDRAYDWIQAGCFLALSLTGGFVWAWFDRARRHDGMIGGILRVIVRHMLGFTMLIYGTIKMNSGQFVPPNIDRLLQPYGESSPMGLLWTFMGFSPAYTMFTGLIECIGGLLLLFQRTTTLGALIVAGAMSNVAMLNFCYDVPVKLFSTTLLLMAIFLLVPEFRRLANLFILNRPVEAAPLRSVRPVRWMRSAAGIAKVLVLAGFVASLIAVHRQGSRFRNKAPSLEIAGTYEVESFSRDGEILPPLLNDPVRWRCISVRSSSATVRGMDDVKRRFRLKTGSASQSLVLETTEENPKAFSVIYSRIEPDRLRMEGEIDGHALVLHLKRIDEKKFLLVSRGFHWINETPFNR